MLSWKEFNSTELEGVLVDAAIIPLIYWSRSPSKQIPIVSEDRYSRIEKIGEGSYGRVYSTEDGKALKVPTKEYGYFAEFGSICALQELQSVPEVVRVHEIIVMDFEFRLVMELGVPLDPGR